MLLNAAAASCCCWRHRAGCCLPAGPSGPSGPAPLDAERLLLTAKWVNNDESSAAKARLRLFQKSKIVASSASGRNNRAPSNARRAAVARAKKSPEQAQEEHHQLLKSHAHVRFENLKDQDPPTSTPASIGAGLTPLPGAQTRRSPNAQNRDFRPYLISRAHVRFENALRQKLLFSAPADTRAGPGPVPCPWASSYYLGKILQTFLFCKRFCLMY